MSDVSPYGTTQHADADLTTADAMFGSRVTPVIGNSLMGSAATFSTAPYVPPGPKRAVLTHQHPIGPRIPDRMGKCRGKDDTCKAPPMRSTDWCVFHTPGNTSKATRENPDFL